MRYRYLNTSLPTHGAGAFYAYGVYDRNQWGKGVRVSIGGYGWRRAWWKPHYQLYRRVAVHFGVGPVMVSVLFGALSLRP